RSLSLVHGEDIYARLGLLLDPRHAPARPGGPVDGLRVETADPARAHQLDRDGNVHRLPLASVAAGGRELGGVATDPGRRGNEEAPHRTADRGTAGSPAGHPGGATVLR